MERDQRTIELLNKASDAGPGDRQALEAEAIELNVPLARYLASRYQRRGIASDDLEQVAYLGLMKAIRGFRPDEATSFAAYAIPTIRGELRRHFRDAGWTIRPPRRVQELQPRIRSVEAELVQVLHRYPTVTELAEALDVDVDAILEATSVDSCFTPHSLDAPLQGEDCDLVADPGSCDPAFARTDVRLVLEPALAELGERDRRILDLRFVDGLSQREIGQAVGISQMQVSRILTRVLDQLRGAIVGEAA